MGAVIQDLDILRQMVWQHFMDMLLIAVLNRLLIIPTFKTDHIQGFFQPPDFIFHGFFPLEKEFQPLPVGFAA